MKYIKYIIGIVLSFLAVFIMSAMGREPEWLKKSKEKVKTSEQKQKEIEKDIKDLEKEYEQIDESNEEKVKELEEKLKQNKRQLERVRSGESNEEKQFTDDSSASEHIDDVLNDGESSDE